MESESLGSEEEHELHTDLKRSMNNAIDLNPNDFDPSMLSQMDDEEVCCPADGFAERCCSHCWFFTTCLACYVYSSLLRLTVIMDTIVTVLMFIGDLTTGHHGSFVEREITHYDFSKSTIFVLVLSLVRNSLLFACFAYKYQTYYSTFITSTILTAFSVAFLSVKLVFCVPETIALPITLYSLTMSLTVYFLYHCVRRRRIRAPPRRVGFRQDYEKLTDTDAQDDLEQITIVRDESTCGPRADRADSVPEGTPPLSLAEPGSQFATFEDMTVHYKYTGIEGKINDSKKPVVVFLHGFGGSVFSWNKIWPMLKKTGAEIMAFDRPGFGLTSRPVAGEWEHNPYTQQYSLMLLFKLMDHLGIQKASFVGHGSGGALATLAAAMRPKRVQSLILVSPAIYTSGFPTFLQSLFRTRLGKNIVTNLVRTEMGELVLRRSYHNKKRLTEDVLRTYKKLLKVRNWDEALVEMARVKPTVKVETKLSLVECPIGIIHGVNDNHVSFRESKRLLAVFERHGQHGELARIENCGHVPHEEVPEQFVAILTQFLKSFSTSLNFVDIAESGD